MGFLKNYTGGSGNFLKLYISASANSKVKISVPLQNYIDSIYVPKDSVKVFQVPNNLGFISEFDSVVKRAIRITSDFPVSVSAMNLYAATTDASIILPTVNIPQGATYIVGNPNSSGFNNSMMMVASQDSSIITITPTSSTTGGHPANTPYTIRLNRGELYQVAGGSLTGSVIQVKTNTKVAVFTGDVCSNFPCGACDHQYEQVMPNQLADTAYYVPPHFGHTNGYYLKIVPIDSNITVKVNNYTLNNLSRLTPVTINVKGDSGYYIRSDKRFHVFQFLKGASCNGYITSGYGDPAILEVLSNQYMGESAMFSTVNSTNLRDHFVSIVIHTPAKNNVYFDRTKVDSSEFKPFPYDNSKSYAMLKINDGTHLVECSNGMLAYCYGIGFYESYLYLAGFSLPNFDLDFKDSVVKFDCKNQKITMQFRAKTSKPLKKYTWYFGDNTTGSGNPVQHTYNTTGFYKVKLVGEDFAGKKDSVTKQLKIDWPSFDPVRNKIICGIDTVTFEERNPFFTNFKWQDSSTRNYLKVWDNKNVWVYATDTTGYCKFVDTGVVGKIDIFSALKVDSLDKCFKFNRFRFTDSTKIFADQIEHKAWVFPFATYWDQNSIDVKFPMPGKYKVYFDVYTKQVNCKARYPIDVTVHPNPKGYTNFNGEDFCSGTPLLFKDSSQIVTGYIKEVKWIFDDSTSVVSDSSKTHKTLFFDPIAVAVTRKYKQIPISNFNCSDTINSAINIWPKPSVNFSLNTADTIKCLPAARWTFNSNVKVYFDTFSLNWDLGNGNKGTAKDMRNIRYTSPGTYKVKLIAKETSMGCSDSLTKNIEVLSVPVARIAIPDTVQCFNGHRFTVKDSSSGKYLSYSWQLGNNQTDTARQVDSIQYNTSGTYTLKLLVKNPYPSCIDSTSRKVYVLSSPKAQFTTNNDTQCLKGNLFNLSNTSTFYQTYAKSQWLYQSSFFNGTDTNFSQLNKSFNDTGSISVRLIVSDKEACTDTTYGTIRIASHSKSFLTINDSIQCLNKNRFVFKTSIPAGETRLWKINQATVQSGDIDSLVRTLNTPGTYKITLLGSNTLGCGDSSNSQFIVLPKPVADFSINNDSQCYNAQNFALNSTSTANGDIINTYSYKIDNTSIYNQANINGLNFGKSGQIAALLRITTAENCTDSIQKWLTVLPLPQVQMLGDTVCLGESSEFKASQLSGNPVKTWNWDFGDGNTGNGRTTNCVYNKEGSYTIKLVVTDTFNCGNSITLNNAQVVNPLPNTDFSIVVSDFGINQSKISVKATESNALNYQWRFPNGQKADKDTSSLVISDLLKGDIYLFVTNQYGCIDSSYKNIYVYPNNFNVYIPSAFSINNDLLNDVFKPVGIGAYRDYNMSLYNRWGEMVFNTTDPDKGWDGKYQGEFVMEGIYTYYIHFTFVDGKVYRYTGTVTVLR